MVRPTKFTETTIAHLLEAIALGAAYTTACDHAGIAVSTFCDWRDGKYPRGAPANRKLRFSEGLAQAIATADMCDLSVIRDAAQSGDWKAAAWGLERRRPRDYGRKEAREISGPDGSALTVSVRDDRTREVLRRLDPTTLATIREALNEH